jgi:hypothetical protein
MIEIKNKYQLGDLGFNTKAEIKSYYKSMLNSYTRGETPSAEHQYQIYNLLQWHSDFTGKVGAGVERFEVNLGPPYEFQTQCFWIIRKDGTREEFSYTHCIGNIKKQP